MVGGGKGRGAAFEARAVWIGAEELRQERRPCRGARRAPADAPREEYVLVALGVVPVSGLVLALVLLVRPGYG